MGLVGWDDHDLLREFLVRGEKGDETVFLRRPVGTHLRVGIVLLLRFLFRLLFLPVGFPPDVDLVDRISQVNREGVVFTARVGFPVGMSDSVKQRLFWEQLPGRLAEIPGVRAASVSTG